MDDYQIDTKQLWYFIIYPICLVILGLISWGLESIVAYYIQYFVPSININDNTIVHLVSVGILFGMLLGLIFTILEIIQHPGGHVLLILMKMLLSIDTLTIIGSFGLAVAIYFAIVKLNAFFYPPYQGAVQQSKPYEPVKEGFADGTMVQQVQQATQSLQKSLDTLSTATDDTCSVIRGIEKRFLDNATAPEEETPSPAEAKALKAQKLPAAQKQWNQKKQDWSATHGQISMIECFMDESTSELVAANQQLSDLLASAPVQRVVAQVKSIKTSASFAQSYIDQLVSKLNGESFENPEDIIATSKKLIAKANDVQASIRTILDSTRTLKKNYAAIDAKSNDPNTVNNLAANKV